MTFNPDESQFNALKTWYSKDNPLHFEPRHAVIKLAGEAGEILDLYGKHEYKPNFSWWNCKHCGYDKDNHGEALYCPIASFEPIFYTPLILDELGDFWYYLRIISYQKSINIGDWASDWASNFYPAIDILLSRINFMCSKMLYGYINNQESPYSEHIYYIFDDFMMLLRELKCPLNDLTELNYKKLNSEPTNHGWKNATIKTIDDCPPMSEFY